MGGNLAVAGEAISSFTADWEAGYTAPPSVGSFASGVFPVPPQAKESPSVSKITNKAIIFYSLFVPINNIDK